MQYCIRFRLHPLVLDSSHPTIKTAWSTILKILVDCCRFPTGPYIRGPCAARGPHVPHQCSVSQQKSRPKPHNQKMVRFLFRIVILTTIVYGQYHNRVTVTFVIMHEQTFTKKYIFIIIVKLSSGNYCIFNSMIFYCMRF